MDSEYRQNRLCKFIYVTVALLLFGVLWFFTFRTRQSSIERTEYPVVILGDSLVGQCRDETSVARQLEKLTGMSVFNGAFGGTCMAMQKTEEDSNYSMDLLSMVALSKAIAADDFGVQQTIRCRRAATDYFSDVIDDLERVDFTKVKFLVLEFGVNDFHAAIPVSGEDPQDETTYTGAIRSVILMLREKYPDMQVIFLTPTYAWYFGEGLTCEEYDMGYGPLEVYADAALETARDLQAESVDLYHDLYVHKEWDDWQKYTEDGLHPNGSARERIAQLLAKKIQEKW